MISTLEERIQEAIEWPVEHKLKLLAALQHERWISTARPEQLAPEGQWRIWYLMAGRGAGKTRAAAEWLADMEAAYEPGEWAIVAPTLHDAVTVCVESPESGILSILGPRIISGERGWNRSLGELHLKSGSIIYVTGADKGAPRIQGKNLRGLWADEVGLWVNWDMAWNQSIQFAVRKEPGQIVASGTPKMGHGLVRYLVENESVVKTRMSTYDNLPNLSRAAVEELKQEFAGRLLGRQELDGEWIAAIEGDALKRAWWRYYEPHRRTEKWEAYLARLPKFGMVVVSVDTPLKDKESSDFVAIQVWGVEKANRYLLDARTERMSYEQAKRAVSEMSRWARRHWRSQQRTLIENTGYGVELVIDLQRELGSIVKISPGSEGTKGQRALAASGDLESGNVYLPGRIKDDLSGPDERSCPAFTISLVEEAALFQIDGSHDSHDDQVDAWSQCMNWLRSRQVQPARTYSSFKIRKR